MGWTERVRRALRPAARGAVLAAVAVLAGVPVLVAAVVSIDAKRCRPTWPP